MVVLLLFFLPKTDRDIEIVRPLHSVEVIETETAHFDTEISEEGVHANWKLKGETLNESPVSTLLNMWVFRVGLRYMTDARTEQGLINFCVQ